MLRKDFWKSGAVGALIFGGASFYDLQGSFAESTNPSGHVLKLGDKTLQPVGHYHFCQEMPSECNRHFESVPRAKLTESLWDFIVETDKKFNRQITSISDADHWNGREEVWSYADDNLGDCEDYVLEKRRVLESRIHPSNLLITLVRKPDGEGHAVLTVRTDRGDFFLDNLEKPMSVGKSRYEIIKTVDPVYEGGWVSVQGKKRMPVPPGETSATQPLAP